MLHEIQITFPVHITYGDICKYLNCWHNNYAFPPFFTRIKLYQNKVVGIQQLRERCSIAQLKPSPIKGYSTLYVNKKPDSILM